jgi:hypothetical protein
MGLSRGKLRRLERDAEREMVTLVCQERGEEFRVAEDTGPAGSSARVRSLTSPRRRTCSRS